LARKMRSNMKTRHACGLLTFLLLSALLVPSPAQADIPLKWAVVDKPGKEGNIVVSPSEVSEIAVGSSSVIYVIDSEYSKIYRSLDAGKKWEDITSGLLDAGAELPASKIAVSPDKLGIVAVVTNNGTEVYLSEDGGIDWDDSGIPADLAGAIQAITISKEYSQGSKTYMEIAIGTADWGNNTTSGQVWVRQLGIGCFGTGWKNQSLTVDLFDLGGEVSAISYSPDFRRDRTILVVASTGSDVTPAYENATWLCLGERDASAGTTSWNATEHYPAKIIPAGNGPGVFYIHSSLALPSDYSSDDESSRQLFVSCDRKPDPDGYNDVYWLDDYTPHRMYAGGDNVPIDISSISYYGTLSSGELLAGDANPVAGSLTVQVRRTSDPFDTFPKWQTEGWDLSSVPPTGPGNAKVSWSPDGKIAYCGTGQSPGKALDESAVSASLDGDKWRQLGLMNTIINIADIAPAPDYESLFITTYSHLGPEGVWRSAGDPLGKYWERVLTMDTTTDAVILRLSANYTNDYAMYAAEAGGNLMAVSYDRGNTWQWCNKAPEPVIDMVVRDEETVYVALPDGYVSKTTDAAWMWEEPVDTGLSDINMLAIAGNETILVGGRKGDVAYSTDGGDTFTRIPESIGCCGDVQVIADSMYVENGIIYAATSFAGKGVWRWTIGVSIQWEQIDKSIGAWEEEQRIAGLATGPEGTLYAVRSEPAGPDSGGMIRSLNPSAEDPNQIEFDLVNQGLPVGTTFDPTRVFPNTLPYLKLSGDSEQNELWSVDTTNQLIYRYHDTLCKIGPSLSTPEDGAVIPIGPCACNYVTSLFLRWKKLSETTTYEAAIYLNPDGTLIVWSGSSNFTDNCTDIMAVGGAISAYLESGTTYYWRVRSIEPIKSPWSELWSFAPALGGADWSPIAEPTGMSPSAGATNVPIRPAFTWNPSAGATGYEFILARDSEFTNVVVSMTGADALAGTAWSCDRNLAYSTTYFWKLRPVSPTSYGEWVTSVFTTESAPSTPSSAKSSTSPSPSIPSHLIWIVIGMGAALIIALLILTVRTRR
jgi:photosystem II stability/assembly factor-like uncharacterized protein